MSASAVSPGNPLADAGGAGPGGLRRVKALLQRVSRAEVAVEGAVVATIGTGLLVLLGVEAGDGPDQADWLAAKTLALRIFPDHDFPDDGKAMNLSVVDIGGEVLVVSQFTLAADTRRGNRPGFGPAAPPETAEALYEGFIRALRRSHPRVASGRFGADMEVALTNDGPATFMLER